MQAIVTGEEWPVFGGWICDDRDLHSGGDRSKAEWNMNVFV
jgi:hypothetical protein